MLQLDDTLFKCGPFLSQQLVRFRKTCSPASETVLQLLSVTPGLRTSRVHEAQILHSDGRDMLLIVMLSMVSHDIPIKHRVNP